MASAIENYISSTAWGLALNYPEYALTAFQAAAATVSVIKAVKRQRVPIAAGALAAISAPLAKKLKLASNFQNSASARFRQPGYLMVAKKSYGKKKYTKKRVYKKRSYRKRAYRKRGYVARSSNKYSAYM